MLFNFSTFLSYVLLLACFAVGICAFIESASILETLISIVFFSANIFVWDYLVDKVVDVAISNKEQPTLGILFFMKKIALLLCLGGMISLMSLSSIVTGLLVVVISLILSGLPFDFKQEFSNVR